MIVIVMVDVTGLIVCVRLWLMLRFCLHLVLVNSKLLRVVADNCRRVVPHRPLASSHKLARSGRQHLGPRRRETRTTRHKKRTECRDGELTPLSFYARPRCSFLFLCVFILIDRRCVLAEDDVYEA